MFLEKQDACPIRFFGTTTRSCRKSVSMRARKSTSAFIWTLGAKKSSYERATVRWRRCFEGKAFGKELIFNIRLPKEAHMMRDRGANAFGALSHSSFR